MTSEEQPAGPSAASSARPQRSGPSRRRRGFRPSRRPPRRPPASSEAAVKPSEAPPEAMETQQTELAERAESFEPGNSRESGEPERPARPEGSAALEPPSPEPEGPTRRADAAPAIRQAIEEVQKINRDLESLLLEMEKALETLEEAEVQKYAEEREIEALRSAVRQ